MAAVESQFRLSRDHLVRIGSCRGARPASDVIVDYLKIIALTLPNDFRVSVSALVVMAC